MSLDHLTRDTTARSTIYSSDTTHNGAEPDASRGSAASEAEMRQQRKRHLSGGKYCSITSLCALDDGKAMKKLFVCSFMKKIRRVGWSVDRLLFVLFCLTFSFNLVWHIKSETTAAKVR